MILKIAWKNMFRYKRRTLITAFAITAGVFFTVLLNSLLCGMDEESFRNLLDYETAGAKIYAPGYFEKREQYPADCLIEADTAAELEKFLTARKTAYTPALLSSCEIYFNEDWFETSGSLSAVLCGLDPEKSRSVFRIAECLEEGMWLNAADGEPYSTGAVVGSWMATDMKAQTGWYITIQCKGRGGFSQTIDVPITGIIQCPNTAVNAGMIFMDLRYLNDILEMDGAVTEYAIAAGSIRTVDAMTASLKSDFAAAGFDGSLEIYSWREIAEEIVHLQENISSMSGLIMFFMFVIAAVGISNTMLMSVLERRNEIAMLKAMGYTPFYIKRLFMWEGISIGLVGCAAGLAIALPVNIPLVNHGIDFTDMLTTIDMGYRISGVLHSTWDIPGCIRIVIGALVIAAVSAYIPTGSTVKKEIAEIFRKT